MEETSLYADDEFENESVQSPNILVSNSLFSQNESKYSGNSKLDPRYLEDDSLHVPLSDEELEDDSLVHRQLNKVLSAHYTNFGGKNEISTDPGISNHCNDKVNELVDEIEELLIDNSNRNEDMTMNFVSKTASRKETPELSKDNNSNNLAPISVRRSPYDSISPTLIQCPEVQFNPISKSNVPKVVKEVNVVESQNKAFTMKVIPPSISKPIRPYSGSALKPTRSSMLKFDPLEKIAMKMKKKRSKSKKVFCVTNGKQQLTPEFFSNREKAKRDFSEPPLVDESPPRIHKHVSTVKSLTSVQTVIHRPEDAHWHKLQTQGLKDACVLANIADYFNKNNEKTVLNEYANMNNIIWGHVNAYAKKAKSLLKATFKKWQRRLESAFRRSVEVMNNKYLLQV